MGKHHGFVITKIGASWLARAWNPAAGKYTNKRFPPPYDKTHAITWAKAESASHVLVARSHAPRDPRSKPTAQLAAAFQLDLARRGRSASHLADVAQVLARFVAAVPDLSARDALPRAEAFLDTLVRAPRGAQTPQREGNTGADGTPSPPVSPVTRNRYLTTIRAMTRWATKRLLLARDPLAPIGRVKEPDTLKAQFTISQLQRLVQAVDHPYHLRFCLQLYAGLRSQEAHNLQWQHVDPVGRVIDVRLGDYNLKGQKERIVPLQWELAAVLAARARRSDGFLFDERIRSLAGHQHVRDLRRFCKDTGVTIGDRSPHSLRHGYAGLMTATGVPSLMLGAYLGHSNSQTTAGYTTLAVRYEAIARAWPRGEFTLLQGARCRWAPSIGNCLLT